MSAVGLSGTRGVSSRDYALHLQDHACPTLDNRCVGPRGTARGRVLDRASPVPPHLELTKLQSTSNDTIRSNDLHLNLRRAEGTVDLPCAPPQVRPSSRASSPTSECAPSRPGLISPLPSGLMRSVRHGNLSRRCTTVGTALWRGSSTLSSSARVTAAASSHLEPKATGAPKLDFTDPRLAFAGASTFELLRGAAVLTACSQQWLVQRCEPLLSLSNRLVGRHATEAALKHTVFAHFVAGECETTIAPKLRSLQARASAAVAARPPPTAQPNRAPEVIATTSGAV